MPVFTSFVKQDPRIFLPKYEVMKYFASLSTEDLQRNSFYKNNMVKYDFKYKYSNGTTVAREWVPSNLFYVS